MIRRFNYTGRVAITRDLTPVRLLEGSSGKASRFSADLSGLSSLGFPASARVYVESHVRQSSMRFDFGTIGKISPPTDTSLSEIDAGEIPQFRVLVVDVEGRPGRLLGVAAQVRPKEEDEDESRKPILPLFVTDLGEKIWELHCGPDVKPILKINSRIANLRERLDVDPVLRGAVFPAAVRELLRITLQPDVDDSLEWVRDWTEFAEALLGEEWTAEGRDPAELDTYVDRVVTSFCAQHRWATLAQPVASVLEADYD